MTIAKKADPVLAALAVWIGGVVEAKIAELQIDHAEYSANARPKGISRRVFNKTCRSGEVAGAVKDGARVWRCSRAAWNAARTTTPKFATVHRIRPSDEELDAEAAAAIAASDMRPTVRGSR